MFNWSQKRVSNYRHYTNVLNLIMELKSIILTSLRSGITCHKTSNCVFSLWQIRTVKWACPWPREVRSTVIFFVVMTQNYHQTTDNLITKKKFHYSMWKFWPLGDEIQVFNDFCALAPNSVTAARFLYSICLKYSPNKSSQIELKS